jgi:hypothetical protein
MSGRIWFNARVLCCEESPDLATYLHNAKARVSWAPLLSDSQPNGSIRALAGDWADPDYPYRLVEGHEVVLLRWPDRPQAPESVRWWLSAAMHLGQSARRSRVKAFGFAFSPDSPPLLRHSGQFLAEYLATLELSALVVSLSDSLLTGMETRLAIP